MPRNGNPRRSVLPFMMVLALIGGVAMAGEERIHQVGKFRVRYQTEGTHAVASADRNRNGVPDQVEDILTQVMAAHLLFVEALGFPDPFQTERFRAATVLDIRIQGKEALKSNGVAFDELQRSANGDWIGMRVASSVHATSNRTPAHELFHLIQYGTSYFKNRWYTEGTARWSERALGPGGLGPVRNLDAWPLSQAQADAIFGRTYDASEYFWNPLAARLDATGEIPDSQALDRLQAMRYTDGSPVLQDRNLTGWKFVREVIIELGKVDDDAFRELGYDRWSEVNQFSPQNDVFILRAVERVVTRLESATPSDQDTGSGEQDQPIGSGR